MGAEDSLFASGEVDVEIQPAIASLLECEARFEADDVLGDMLEAFALTDRPIFLSLGRSAAKNFTTASSPRRTALPLSFSNPQAMSFASETASAFGF